MAVSKRLDSIRSVWKQIWPDRHLALLAFAMVVCGIVLRIQRLGFPKQFTWDEHHFVENARNYLRGVADWNDHPPLGKLIIAQGMAILGDNSFGWRFFPLCFGLAAIPLAWGIGQSLFRSWKAGAIAAAVVATDGFFIAYSRTALLDGMLVTLIMASAFTTIVARKPWQVAVACVLVGLAGSIKYTGAVMVVPVVFTTLVLARAPRWTVCFLVLTPLVYWAAFGLGLSIQGQSASLQNTWFVTFKLLKQHLGATQMTHWATSYWYTWFIPTKPLLLRNTASGGYIRPMTTLGNPLLWWSATLLLGASVVALFWKAVARCVALLGRKCPRIALGYFDNHARAIAALVFLWLLPLLPWIITSRDSYIYHYLPCYGFALLLVAGAITWLYERKAIWGVVAVLLVAEVFVFYAPVWGQLQISRESMNLRMFLPLWR